MVVVVGGGCGFVVVVVVGGRMVGGGWVFVAHRWTVALCVGGGEKEKAEGLKLNEENDLSVGRVL